MTGVFPYQQCVHWAERSEQSRPLRGLLCSACAQRDVEPDLRNTPSQTLERLHGQMPPNPVNAHSGFVFIFIFFMVKLHLFGEN